MKKDCEITYSTVKSFRENILKFWKTTNEEVKENSNYVKLSFFTCIGAAVLCVGFALTGAGIPIAICSVVGCAVYLIICTVRVYIAYSSYISAISAYEIEVMKIP